MALTPRNRQEEWYQEMINAQTGKYLPSISSADAGKVMTVSSNGDWEVDNVPSPIPAVAQTDKDKYLHTNQTTGALEWSAVSGGSGASILPAEIENDLYTETLGEVVEFQVTILGDTDTYNGIEAVGMTAEIEETIHDDTTDVGSGAPMAYTYRIGDEIYDTASAAISFVPMLGDDGKYYFVTGDTVFDDASGEVVAVYKIELQFPSNVLCLYDQTDPKGDESYLPEYAEYDDGYFVSSDYDASAFYNSLTHGNASYAVFPNPESNNGYAYSLAGSFYTETVDGESELCVGFFGADVYIYNWTGSSNESLDDEISSDDSGNVNDGGVVIDPIGGGDHEMPAPDSGNIS